MTTTSLAEMHELVSDAFGRSTSLDTLIPRRVQMAARWIERNYTFQYMRQLRTLSVDPDAAYPYIVSLFGLEVKKIETLRIRYTADDGSYYFSPPLGQVKPADRSTRPIGTPESYWLNGVSSLILNSVPDQARTLEGHFVLFTAWQEADDWTHWLLDNATQLLLTRTVMSMISRTRDPAMYQAAKAEFDLELQSFKVSEEDIQASAPVVARWEPLVPFQTTDQLRSS